METGLTERISSENVEHPLLERCHEKNRVRNYCESTLCYTRKVSQSIIKRAEVILANEIQYMNESIQTLQHLCLLSVRLTKQILFQNCYAERFICYFQHHINKLLRASGLLQPRVGRREAENIEFWKLTDINCILLVRVRRTSSGIDAFSVTYVICYHLYFSLCLSIFFFFLSSEQTGCFSLL